MNKKEFIIVLIVTFAVVMAWVIADIIHASNAFKEDPKVKTLLADKVDPNYNSVALEKVKAITLPVSASEASAPKPTLSPNNNNRSLGVSTQSAKKR